MKQFKPSDADLLKLQAAATNLQEANKQANTAKATIEANKKVITDWLKENRDLDLDRLEIGETVYIEKVVFIEIGKMNKFDEQAFQIEHGKLHLAFKKDFPVKKFKVAA